MISKIFILVLIFIIFIAVWFYFKNSEGKTGLYTSTHTYYDVLTERLDVKLSTDTSSIIEKYLNPSESPSINLFPSLYELNQLQTNDPQLYSLYENNGTAQRVINLEGIKTWILIGSDKVNDFSNFMAKLNQLKNPTKLIIEELAKSQSNI